MNTAEKIIQEVRTLPEAQAQEVLDFVGFLKSKQQAETSAARKAARAGLARFRGRFKAVKISRDELYDRACLR
jgi:hypothetical protein